MHKNHLGKNPVAIMKMGGGKPKKRSENLSFRSAENLPL
jgi:hypothetical protein